VHPVRRLDGRVPSAKARADPDRVGCRAGRMLPHSRELMNRRLSRTFFSRDENESQATGAIRCRSRISRSVKSPDISRPLLRRAAAFRLIRVADTDRVAAFTVAAPNTGSPPVLEASTPEFCCQDADPHRCTVFVNRRRDRLSRQRLNRQQLNHQTAAPSRIYLKLKLSSHP
jgi:hypothetical protein